MRKRVHVQAASTEPNWLRVEELAEVSVSSEDANRPIEFALVPGAGSGWRAATPGEQSVLIRFDEPQAIRLIQLRFDEAEHQRVQEFCYSGPMTAARRFSRLFGSNFRSVRQARLTRSRTTTCPCRARRILNCTLSLMYRTDVAWRR